MAQRRRHRIRNKSPEKMKRENQDPRAQTQHLQGDREWGTPALKEVRSYSVPHGECSPHKCKALSVIPTTVGSGDHGTCSHSVNQASPRETNVIHFLSVVLPRVYRLHIHKILSVYKTRKERRNCVREHRGQMGQGCQKKVRQNILSVQSSFTLHVLLSA